MRQLIIVIAAALLLLAGCRPVAGVEGIPVPENSRLWTTVVYMAADNDLEGAALEDLKEIVQAGPALKAAGHTVLVLLDRAADGHESDGNWTDTRLFEIQAGPEGGRAERISCPGLRISGSSTNELNTSDPSVLHEVLAFAGSAYPARQHALILWGHGMGWRGYAVDDGSSSVMTLPELRSAVSGLSQPLSVIALDCCYGAMLETAYELADSAALIIASEKEEPVAGWNYSLFFNTLSSCGAAGCTPYAWASAAVDAYRSQYADTPGASLTVLSGDGIGDVFSAFDELSALCASGLTTRTAVSAFCSFLRSQTDLFISGEYPAYQFLDVYSFAQAVAEGADTLFQPPEAAAVRSEANRLMSALSAATVSGFCAASGEAPARPSLGVYYATVRAGGVVDAEYPLLYVQGSGIAGQSAFVHDSAGWVPHQAVTGSSSLLDRLFRMPL